MIYIVVAFIVVVACVSAYRLRPGGPGPQVNYVPRRFRGQLNAQFRRAGWQEPYDEDGNRSEDRSEL